MAFNTTTRCWLPHLYIFFHIYIFNPEPSCSFFTQLPPGHITQNLSIAPPPLTKSLPPSCSPFYLKCQYSPPRWSSPKPGRHFHFFIFHTLFHIQSTSKILGSASKIHRRHAFYPSLLPPFLSKSPSSPTYNSLTSLSASIFPNPKNFSSRHHQSDF